MSAPLPPPARYVPIRGGRYDVAPALRPFGTRFGNGPADERAFQIDSRFQEFRENKLRCRGERPGKYIAAGDYQEPVAAAAARFIATELVREYPQHFAFAGGSCSGWVLDCGLTGERLRFDSDMRLLEARGEPAPRYADAFD